MQDLIEAVAAAPSIKPGRWTILSERLHGGDDAARLVEAAFSGPPRVVELAS